MLLSQGLLLFLILSQIALATCTWESLGFKRGEPLWAIIFVGFLAYGLTRVATTLVLSRFMDPLEARRNGLRSIGFLLPRNPAKRCLMIAVICAFNPFTEEVLYRGLLVHQTALLSARPWIPVVLGGVVILLGHAYQGWRAAPRHLAFFASTIALMYSRYGLGAAIAAHVLGDAVPLLGYRESLRAYTVERRRARRSAKKSAQVLR